MGTVAREINTVGVVGLGTMGAGIVEVFARNGVDVVAVEISEARAGAGPGQPDRLDRPGRGQGQARPPTTATRCSPGSTSRSGSAALHDVDFVIEAVPEHLDLKQQIFAELDRVCPPHAILATNTVVAVASPRSRSPPTGPTRSSACTSSTRRR